MTLRHIRIFLSVCDHGNNTTKAAEAMCVTQPAVSLAIRELEEYYGVLLFDRLGRRLMITAAGQQFREYAAHIARLFDQLEKGMRDWDTFGILRIGASITIGSQFLPGYTKAYYDRFPGAEIHALIGPSEQLEQKLLTNELDFALIEGIVHEPSLISQEYMEDYLSVICPPGGRFHTGQHLTIQEFRQQKFLLREKGSGTREVFDRVVESAGFSISPVWEAVSTTALVNAVINGLGISVLPSRMVAGAVAQGLVVAVEVENLSFHRNFRIVYHRDKYLTACAKAFMDLCRHYNADHPIFGYSRAACQHPCNPL